MTLVKYKGENQRGPAHRSPYPVSRRAPPNDLVMTARLIAEADDALSIQAAGKLRSLAEQLEALQKQARQILRQTEQSRELAPCTLRFSQDSRACVSSLSPFRRQHVFLHDRTG